MRATLLAIAAAGLGACHAGAPQPAPTLAAVDPVAAPPLTPQNPIATYAPSGADEADPLAQIRVIFRDDVIPLEQLESPAETAVLAKFSIEPALPGHFRFLTPRMVGFQADGAIPLATRVRVRVASGIRDAHGRTLAHDFSWSFETADVALSDLPLQDDPKSQPDPGPLLPEIDVTSNAALDLASLTAHGSLVPASGGASIALVVPAQAVATSSPSPPPDRAFDPAARSYAYAFVPAQPLAKGTTYRVVFAPGIRSRTGNLPSADSFEGRIRTYGPLTYDGLTQATSSDDRFDNGTPQLAFANPLDPKTLGAIHVAPRPAAGNAIGRIDDSTIGINPALLAPNTAYTVTVDATLADTYGQTLGTPVRATFRTSDLTPAAWAPSGTNLFPAAREVALDVTGVNLAKDAARATFAKLAPLDVVQNDDPAGDDSPLYHSAAAHSGPLAVSAAPNVERTLEIPLRAELAGPAGVLAYRISADVGRTAPVTYDGLVQLTNLGVFAQWFPDSGFVRVNHLSDGSAAAGTQIAIYRAQSEDKHKTAALPCAIATTQADGIAHFSGPAFAQCAALDNGNDTAPALVTLVRDGADWTYVRTDDSSGAYGGGISTGWSSATPIAQSTIFSDRDLYQPGETAQLTAVGWFLTSGVLARGRAARYSVTLELPNQEKRALPDVALNAFGTASIPIVIDKHAPLGYYSVHARAPNGESIDGGFRVAEFKPPNFKVALALAQTTAVAGSSIVATTASTYLFGSPVAGASTAYDVTRSLFNYTWDKDAGFAFGRQWFWPEETPAVSSDVMARTVPVDASGRSTATIPVAADLPYPMAYEVDADTTDVSNLSVGDSKTFTAFPGPVQIGLKTDFVATAGSATNVAVVALDPHGTPVPGTHVHLELQRATYLAATAVVEGGDQPEASVTYKTVASSDVESSRGSVTAQLTPPAAGTYRIRANVAGAKSDATETDAQIYVTGPGDVAWGQADPNQLNVKLDKATYRPGDIARAVIQSPFPKADIVVAVIRNGVMWQQRLHAHGSAPTVAFTVTAAMLPNAAFEAIAVRSGPLPRSAPDDANVAARSGFAPFNVALDSKYVTVAARAARAQLTPGARQTVHLQLTDRAHHPVRGQITLIVANDAVLQLSGYRPPDLVQIVYGAQPISTRYADNRGAIVLQTPVKPVDKGWGYGGGLSTGAEDTRIRRRFDALAYYAGSILTDANGSADAAFTLPDDLTTWRVMAVAATADGRFGTIDTTFLTKKPLIVNPVVPQFARPGDRFDAGIAVTNAANASGATLAIAGSLTPPIAFTNDAGTTQQTSFSAPIDAITKAYRFPMMAGAPGTGTATFTATRPGASDGFAIPLPVIDRAVMESVVSTGVLPSGSTNVALDVAANTPADSGGLQLVFANSVIPDALVAAQNVFDDDDRIAIGAAGRLTVAADLLRLNALTNTSTAAREARANAASALAFLATLQRPDGGFRSYPGATASDPLDSLEVLHAYWRAAAAGLPVDAAARAKAAAFAATVLADPGAWKWCRDDDCKAQLRLHALDALADAGDRRTTFLGDIDALRDRLGLADQIRLTRLLVLAPGYEARGAAEARSLAERVYLTGALGSFNLPQRYAWFAQPVVAQALMTRLLVAQHSGALAIDRSTRSLLALRTNGSWGCTCQNAAALDALVDVASAAGPPANVSATATLAGRTLAHAAFSGHRAATQTTAVPAARLPRGRHTIAVTAQPGPLHYAVTYRYRLAGAQRGRLGGIRVTRTVHPASSANTLATMGLAALAAPLDVSAANVFDVELQVITDHPIDRVQITDPLPAGLEAVDTTFKTSNAIAPAESWEIGDQQIYHDRIEAYADHLGPGIYTLHYLARSVTPGTFFWPGAEARLIDQPQEFGRTASATLHVR